MEELALKSNFDNIYEIIYNYDEFIKLVNDSNINELDINYILKILLDYSNDYIIKLISFLVNFEGILDKINNSELKDDIINKSIKEINLSFLQQLNKLGLYNTDKNVFYLINLIEQNQETNKLLENYLFNNIEHCLKISTIFNKLSFINRYNLCLQLINNCTLEQLNKCNNDYLYCKDAPEYFNLIHNLLIENKINLLKIILIK